MVSDGGHRWLRDHIIIGLVVLVMTVVNAVVAAGAQALVIVGDGAVAVEVELTVGSKICQYY